jgi:cation-transporting ATPase E
MSLVAIVLAAGAGITFPILPRHMTLLSTLTIGIPAFVLALGPNSQRYEPGFLRRIIRFSWPAGAVSGIAVVIADRWTADPTGTAATTTALVCFFTILLLMAQPLRGWKLLLIGLMATSAMTALVVPGLRDFFNLSVTSEMFWKSLVTSLPACAVLFLLRHHHNHGRTNH